MLVCSAFTDVPWMKLKLRRYFTFFSSSFRIFSVTPFSRWTSCPASPRLFTSSICATFGRGTCKSGRLGHDCLLNFLDPPAESQADEREQWDRHREGWDDAPMHAKRVHHYEHETHE